jgi:ABC-2 type transport system ATP-binding protein
VTESQRRTLPSFVDQPRLEPSIISVRDVWMRFPIAKRYRELVLQPFRRRRVCTALENTTFNVQKGDRIAMMGPNGAGKTTLLKLIGGLLFPSEGDITVNGFSTVHHNSAARKSVGFVLNEERSFFWRLTAVQNLEFFGALDNLWGADLRDRIRELISLVGLEEAAERPVAGYSSGMKQRLALARGLIAEPEVLILDEPTRALDPIACDELTELIMSRACTGSGKTLLIATHRIEEAMKLCNKVAVIDRGHLRGLDRIADLTARGITLSQYYRQNVTGGEHDRVVA